MGYLLFPEKFTGFGKRTVLRLRTGNVCRLLISVESGDRIRIEDVYEIVIPVSEDDVYTSWHNDHIGCLPDRESGRENDHCPDSMPGVGNGPETFRKRQCGAKSESVFYKPGIFCSSAFQFNHMSDNTLPKRIIETERLFLRELTEADLPGLCRILQDEDATRFYDRAFTEEEIGQWLDIQVRNYRKLGFGIWAAVQKKSGEMIGHAGISVRHHDDEVIYEIGYMFEKEFWGNGYATEAAIACRKVAFDVFGLEKVCSIIRFDNMASRAVARKNGMKIAEMIYRMTAGKVVPHYIYSIANPVNDAKRPIE